MNETLKISLKSTVVKGRGWVLVYFLNYTSDDENSIKNILLALDKTFSKSLENDSLKSYQLKIPQIKMLKIKAAVLICSVKKVFLKIL